MSGDWRFQHTSRLKAAVIAKAATNKKSKFQHTSRLKAAVISYEFTWVPPLVSTHQPPEGGCLVKYRLARFDSLFQHTSRLKAAVLPSRQSVLHRQVSTHQPPEGGCRQHRATPQDSARFQHTSRLKAAVASLKSLVPSGFAALISLSSQEKREREYNTAFSVTPTFAIS